MATSGTHCHPPTSRHSPFRDRCCRADRAAAATPHLPGACPPRSSRGRLLSPLAQGRVLGTRMGSEVPAPQATSPLARSPQPAARSPQPTAAQPGSLQPYSRRAGNLSGGFQRWARSQASARAPQRGRGPGAARGDGDAWCWAPGAHRGRRPSWGRGLYTEDADVCLLLGAPLQALCLDTGYQGEPQRAMTLRQGRKKTKGLSCSGSSLAGMHFRSHS